MKSINPHYQTLYHYDIDQNEDQIIIIFKVQKDFDSNVISIKYENPAFQKYSLIVSVTNELPFICGTLFAEVLPEPKTSTDTLKLKGKNERYYIITFQKKSKSIWPVLIIGNHPTTNEIDPMSSYYLYTIHAKSTDDEEKRLSQQELIYSAERGLPIATQTYADYLYSNNEKEKSINLLKSSVNKYNDLDSMCQLGRSLYFYKKETQKEGLNFLKRASQLGKKEVNGLIGQILSPFSDFDYDQKNPKEAVYYLQLALDSLNIENDEDSAKIEIDVEVEEEEEVKGNEEIVSENDSIELESEIEKQKKVYLKELEKILDSGVIESIDGKNKKIAIATGSAFVVLAVLLAIYFKRKRK